LRLKRGRARADNAQVDVSIVIPLQGAPEQALRCFESLAALQDAPEHEVIVVDDASVGLEPLLARLAGDVDVVTSPRRVGFAGAASLGAQRASGRVAVLVRGAPQVEPDWLGPLVRALDDPVVCGATSATLGAEDAHLVAAHAVAVRAEDLRRAGGVPPAPDPLALAALLTQLASEGGRAVPVSASVLTAPGARMGAARRTPGETPELTVVIPTLDAASERVRRCVAAVQGTTDAAHDIVVVDNGAPPQGFTAPVNAGLRAARGPYAVVMNDDVEPLPGWWRPLRAALDAGAAVAFPLTIDGPMRRDFAAWCFGVTRDTLETFGHGRGEFFDPRFTIWFQDTDLLQGLREAGRPPVCVDESRIRHGLSETVSTEDPELRAWIEREIARDHRLFLSKRGADALPGRPEPSSPGPVKVADHGADR
jgi:GT2 family glycosyltransferase